MTTKTQELNEALRQSLNALRQSRARVKELEQRATEPIAIVSMACRFPGAPDPEGLWDLVDRGIDAVTEVPKERFDIDRYFDPNPDAIGKSYSRWGGFIGEIDGLDAPFFGISPGEADGVDPQERVLLETTWSLFERAGIVPETLAGSSTGVYVGITANEYLTLNGTDPSTLDAYSLLGTAHSAVVGRISYWLGLMGPNFPVDTACSSSLVCLHLACQGLRNRECDMAVAGGVNLLESPNGHIYFSRLGALSPTGRCHTFSSSADGYVRAEGCGLVLLKRLSDAQRDGDEILALIRGSAVNQDGQSNGFTAPSRRAQEAVVAKALAGARVPPSSVSYVECHGTGTRLGDAIEVQALGAAYGEGRADPLWLGTVKSNIGHSEGAAGIAGVIKTVLALRNRRIPVTLHAEDPNPRIPWDELPVRVARSAVDWEGSPTPRRAGVSAFGFSGTNAHVILEEADTEETKPDLALPPIPPPLLLSARSDRSLAEGAERWAAWFEAHPDTPWPRVLYTAAACRTHFDVRAAIFADGARAAAEVLSALAEGRDHSALKTGRRERSTKVAMLFSGQGSQRPGMGRALYEKHPIFRSALDEICRHIDPHLGRALRPVLFSDGVEPEILDRTELTQPALFALELALFRLWHGWGLKPDLLLGHSIGELTAAHVAGVFSLEDAARLVVARGKLMQACPEGGAMVSIEASEEELRAPVEARKSEVAVAGLNGPRQTVISGDIQAVEEIARRFEDQGRRTTRLTVSHAFHSPHMDGALEDFRKVAETCAFHPPRIPLISNLTGGRAGEEIATADYWVRHLRAPVRFSQGMESLQAEGVRTFLECGPHGTLCGMGAGCLPADAPATFIASLRKGTDDELAIRRAVGDAYVAGLDLDGPAFFGGERARPVQLPGYAFDRRRHWNADGAALTTNVETAGLEATPHPLLRATAEVAEGSEVFFGLLWGAEQPWLLEHEVFGHPLLPGTAFLDLALVAADRAGTRGIKSLELTAPLVIPKERPVRLQVRLGPPGPDGRPISVHSGQGAGWLCHAAGVLLEEEADVTDLGPWPPREAEAIDLSHAYGRLSALGLDYGPTFRGLVEAWRTGPRVYGRVVLPERAVGEAERHHLHPALLDAALHPLALASDREDLWLPVAWSEVALHATGASEIRARLEMAPDQGGTRSVRLLATDGAGQPVVSARLVLRQATAEQVRRAAAAGAEGLYRLEWTRAELSDATPLPGAVVVGGSGELAERLGALHRPSLGALLEELDGDPPPLVIREVDAGAGDLANGAHATAADALTWVQTWSSEARLAKVGLTFVTREGVGTGPDDGARALSTTPVWGVLRTARSELQDPRFRLVDLGSEPASSQLLWQAMRAEEPEVALRGGSALAPRLLPVRDRGVLAPPPDADDYRLSIERRGSLDNLILQRVDLDAPLPAKAVLVEVRATGLNFRDVLNVLGMYPGDPGPPGYEGAGVVLAAGSEADFAPGDRVMGLMQAGAATRARVPDHRFLVRIPDGMSFVDAATVPITFLTVAYALEDLAGLKRGERVLIHAAAGGVGMAAVQLAQHLGAEVFGTASPHKWPLLRSLGLDDDHIASSRNLDFESKFGRVDVVLNALAKEFIDASLSLLSKGGRFLELGKTDIREPATIERDHPGVRYRPLDLIEAGPDRIRALLLRLVDLFSEGALRPLPKATYDLRQAPSAFRFMANARHVGKLVLTPPRRIDPEGTILVSGGTGALGRRVVERLITRHGARRFLLLSRRGSEDAGAWMRSLSDAGAESVQVAACDVTDQQALSEALDSIPARHPLTAVFHLAGLVEDETISGMSEERLHRVLAPKVDGAWNLHELTRDRGLSHFVMFSSVAGTLGGPGQANYAAANAFLDALAYYRRQRGYAATSLAFGPWDSSAGGMTSALTAADRARMRRHGFVPLPVEEGLDLLDRALGRPEAGLVPVRLQLDGSEAKALPLFRGLLRSSLPTATRSAVEAKALHDRLAALSDAERKEALTELVRSQLAGVLGVAGPEAVPVDQPLNELGLESLMAVEIRSVLAQKLGRSLPATLLVDHPTVDALCAFLTREIVSSAPEAPPDSPPPPSGGGEDFDLAAGFEALPLRERVCAVRDSYLERAKRTGRPLLRTINSAADREVLVSLAPGEAPRRMLMFGSNNYLGFGNHPYVRERVAEAIRKFGAGTGGPPLLNGYVELLGRLEERLAELKGTEAAAVFSSGYSANVGLVSGLVRPRDLVCFDAYCHASFIDGLRLAGNPGRPFPHNNLPHLDALLETAPDGADRYVAVEGVYSMEGDVAPLGELAPLCKRRGAFLIVDDAHGTGVLGPQGRGTAAAQGIEEQIDLTMGTFSKVFGVTGGFLAGERAIIDFLRLKARSYVFSAALPPPVLAAVHAGLDLFEQEPELQARLHENVASLVRGLRALGHQVDPKAGIVTLLVPPAMDIDRAAVRFAELGIFLGAIEYPAVPLNAQRFRISVMASHTQADLNRLLEAVEEVFRETGPAAGSAS